MKPIRMTAMVIALFSVGAASAALPATAAAPVEIANVRVAHLVPGLGSMQVGILSGSVTEVGGTTAEETVVEAGVGYGDVGSYKQLPAGTYTVTIRDPAALSDEPVLEGMLSVEGGHSYTVSALGTTSAANIRAIDDNPQQAPDGSSRVRLVNATESGDPVTVSAVNGPVLATDLAFAEPTGYGDVPAQMWNLNVDPGSETSVDLASGASYTVLLLTADNQTIAKAVVDAAPATTTPTEPVQAGMGGAADEFTNDSSTGIALGLAALSAVSLALVARRTRIKSDVLS